MKTANEAARELCMEEDCDGKCCADIAREMQAFADQAVEPLKSEITELKEALAEARETQRIARTVSLKNAIDQAVAEAVKAERERCARIADRDDQGAWGIAREIRTGEQPGWRKQ